MNRIANEVLDELWPRYQVGVDMASKNGDFSAAVLIQQKRDGRLRIMETAFAARGRALPFRFRYPRAARIIDWTIALAVGAALGKLVAMAI